MDYRKIVLEERQRVAKLRSKNLEINSCDKKTSIDSNQKFNDNDAMEPVASNRTTWERIQFREFSLECHRVGTTQNLFYVPRIVSAAEEFRILESIAFAGSNRIDVWKQLKRRRLQTWGKSIDGSIGKDKPLPHWLQDISDELVRLLLFEKSNAPNHVLINEYKFNEGILHHTDGPIYHDLVAILSLGSPCLMTFRHKLESYEVGQCSDRDVFSVVLEPRSLLIFSDSIYSTFMHGIADGVTSEMVGSTAPCLNMHLAGVEEGHKVSVASEVYISCHHFS